jgi:hypothetical protein
MTYKTDRTDKDDEPASPSGFASPPCFMHELDPAWMGYFPRDELLALLNLLLEGERAGARGVGALGRTAEPHHRDVLSDVARDEARYCAMLTGHIERLGGTASRETGAFYDKLLAAPTAADRLHLLDRGQGWVVRKLREALPRIGDDALHADLREMLVTHERNIVRCNALDP